MTKLIEFVTQLNAEQWQAIGAITTALVAIFAAIFAFFQVREARRLRKEQAQPFVIVDLEPSPAASNLIDLTIRNIGTTVAYDVKLNFSPQLQTTLDSNHHPPTEANVIRKGIITMPPGREYRMLFEDAIALNSDKSLPREYIITTNFKDSKNKKHSLKYRLDLDTLQGATKVTVYGVHDAAKALKEINKTLNKWTESQR